MNSVTRVFSSQNTSCRIFRIKVLPRYLKGFNSFDIDLSTTILGKSIDFPICASPTGFHKLADPEGELATARGE